MRRDPWNALGMVESAWRVDQQGNVKRSLVDRTATKHGVFASVASSVIAEYQNNRVVQLSALLEKIHYLPEPRVLHGNNRAAAISKVFLAVFGVRIRIGKMSNLGKKCGDVSLSRTDPTIQVRLQIL